MDGGELFSRIEESQGFSERGENYKYYEYFDCDGERGENYKYCEYFNVMGKGVRIRNIVNILIVMRREMRIKIF